MQRCTHITQKGTQCSRNATNNSTITCQQHSKKSNILVTSENAEFITKSVSQKGQIRVGRCIFTQSGYINPKIEGFKNIIVLTKSSPYGELGPYVLQDESGRIMENLWQFSKVYPSVPKVRIPYTKRQPRIVWEWNAETHITNDGKLTPEFWKWRETGMNCKDPVRYPVGNTKAKSTCLYCLHPDINEDTISDPRPLAPDIKCENEIIDANKLNYVDARKQIYLPTYCALVKKEKKFDKLLGMLNKGENLLIIETDGPHQEHLSYYKEKYDVNDDFLIDNTMLATIENIRIMMNDTKNPFGHGYCLASALLDINDKI